MWRLSWNLGASASWNPQGLPRPVMGLLYLFYEFFVSTASVRFLVTTVTNQRKGTKNRFTLRRLMSYIYIYMEHPFLMFLDHTQRRSTVGRTGNRVIWSTIQYFLKVKAFFVCPAFLDIPVITLECLGLASFRQPSRHLSGFRDRQPVWKHCLADFNLFILYVQKYLLDKARCLLVVTLLTA